MAVLPAMARSLEPSDPRRVGPYRLVALLGEGGMGRVYLAHSLDGYPDRESRPYVAVKVISPAKAGDPEFRARFAREAQAARKVARFCTAEVLDIEVSGKRPYLVTEFIDGPTLAEVVDRRQRLPAAEVERLAIAVATALEAIHAANLIHRDLTPRNIMMSQSRPLVIDFGIARDLDATTTTGNRATPVFMAPEQANGEPLTTAADIHSWGAVVIHAATGRLPFGNAPFHELRARIAHEEPNLTGVPGTLRPIVARAMRKDPSLRPTAPQLCELLTAAMHSAPAETATTRDVEGPRVGSASPTRVLPERQDTSRGVGALPFLLLILAVLAGVFLIQGHDGAPETSARVLAQHPPQALGRPLTGHRQAVLTVAFSKDGKTLASGGFDGTVRLWNIADPAHAAASPQPLTIHSEPVRTVAISRDGRFLVSAILDSSLLLWNISAPAAPKPMINFQSTPGGARAVAFSPDGSILASGGKDKTIHLWSLRDPASPQPIGQPLTGNTEDIATLAFSPDGKTLASGGFDSSVRLWDLSDPASPRPLGEPLLAHGNRVWTIAFTPDGRTLVTGSADQTVRLWDLADRRAPKQLGAPLTGPTDAVWSTAVSPDSTVLAIGSADGTVRFWDIADPAKPTGLGAPLTGQGDHVESVMFSRDGKMFAAAGSDAAIHLWRLG